MTVSNGQASATATVTVDQLAVEVWLQTNPELRAHLLAEAERGVLFAQSIAPVGEKSHTLKSGYVDHPGDYRDSITATVVQGHRRQIGRVVVGDYKKFWVEYGSSHMPKYAVLRHTKEHLESTQ